MESVLSRLLDALPGMVWTARADGTTDFVNQHWTDYTGQTLEAASASGWTTLFHPDDLAGALAAWDSTFTDHPPNEINIEARLRRADGLYRWFKIQTRPLRDASGALLGWCGINTDMEDQARAEAQLAAEKRLLELAARGMELPNLLDELCLQFEGLFPGAYCSIIFVDDDGHRFRVGAGASLPAGYNALLDGLKIDPAYGPCSLAIETRQTVIVTNPQGDPRWRPEGWPAAMAEFGLVSCWSAPILSSRGDALGIFAIYRRDPVGPTVEEQELIERFTKIAGIGFERAQSDAALVASETDLRRANHFLTGGQRLSKTGSFSLDTLSDTQVWSEENYRLWEFDPTVPPTMEMVIAAIHPDDRDDTLSAFAEATRAARDFEVFYRIVTPVGGVKHVHTVMEIIPEFTDRIVYLGSTQDVTERHLAEAALKASEADLRRANRYLAGAQRLSKTGSFTWDVATDAQDWSEELYRIWEMDPTDDRSVPALHTSKVHPDDVAGVEAILDAALAAGRSYELSYRIITRSGAVKHLHTVNERVAEIPDRLVYVGATQDLTRSRMAEDALKANEAQLRRANSYLQAAQKLSRIGSFTWDVASNALDWSEENFRIWEVELRATPTVEMVMEAIHPEDLPRVARVMDDARRTGGDFEVSYRIMTARGGVKHVHTVSSRIPEIADRFCFLGSNQDVTESKLAEAALKASEEQLSRANRYLSGAQTLSKIGSFTWDVAVDQQDWSDENYRIWAFDPETAPTMQMVLAAIHPDDLDLALRTVAGAAETGEDMEVFFRIITPGDGVKHLHTVATRVAEYTDRLVYIGSTQDVTAVKLAEADLARANTYLLAAQNLSQTGSFTWDVAADEHNWSEVIYQVFGFEPGVKVTMAMMMGAIHPEDIPQVEALIGGAQIGENFGLVFRIVTPAGDVRHAHVMGHRIDQIPDRPVFMGALQDITARKLAENDLNHARTQLAHMSRVTALSALTASIAHEVSQPLAGIITNANTCLRTLAADPPDLEVARATAQRTLRDGNRASEVIKRLRALFNRKPPRLERLDLDDAVREVLALSASELQRRRVTLRTEFAGELPHAHADRVQLQQVILNLVLNAADAMAGAEGHARDLKVSTRCDPDGMVTLDVADTGPGIDPQQAEHLFQPFHTTKPDGMGIGLSISRSIIEAHGGRISGVSNANGQGATFSFSIPSDTVPVAETVLRQA